VRAPSPRRAGLLSPVRVSPVPGESNLFHGDRPVSNVFHHPIVEALGAPGTDAAGQDLPADQGSRPLDTMADSPPRVRPRPQSATGQDASSQIQTSSMGEIMLVSTPQLLPDGARSAHTAGLDSTTTTHQPYTRVSGYSKTGLPSLSGQLLVPTPAHLLPIHSSHQLHSVQR